MSLVGKGKGSDMRLMPGSEKKKKKKQIGTPVSLDSHTMSTNSGFTSPLSVSGSPFNLLMGSSASSSLAQENRELRDEVADLKSQLALLKSKVRKLESANN